MDPYNYVTFLLTRLQITVNQQWMRLKIIICSGLIMCSIPNDQIGSWIMSELSSIKLKSYQKSHVLIKLEEEYVTSMTKAILCIDINCRLYRKLVQEKLFLKNYNNIPSSSLRMVY